MHMHLLGIQHDVQRKGYVDRAERVKAEEIERLFDMKASK